MVLFLSVIMVNVSILSVVRLRVDILNAVCYAECHGTH
jgi:hypothetical protein